MRRLKSPFLCKVHLRGFTVNRQRLVSQWEGGFNRRDNWPNEPGL
jgi:hypothetical protein